jgi:hypothetical protein
MHLCTGDMFLLLPTYRQVTTKIKDKNQHFPSHVGAHSIIVDLVIMFIVVFGATSGGPHIELSKKLTAYCRLGQGGGLRCCSGRGFGSWRCGCIGWGCLVIVRQNL